MKTYQPFCAQFLIILLWVLLFIPVFAQNNYKKLTFFDHSIDTRQSTTDYWIDDNRQEARYFLYQHEGRMTEDVIDEFRKMQIEYITYLPYDGALLKMNIDVYKQLKIKKNVAFLAPYLPEERLSKDLSEIVVNLVEDKAIPLNLLIFKNENIDKVIVDIQNLGGSILFSNETERYVKIGISLAASQVQALSEVQAIIRISTIDIPELNNDRATKIIGIPQIIHSLNLTGKGQKVGICDSGIEINHEDFQKNNIDIQVLPVATGYFNAGTDDGFADDNGHGTHVSGSIIGTGLNSKGKYRGVAPDALLHFQAARHYAEGMRADGTLFGKSQLSGIPNDLTELFDSAYVAGVRVHNNSWGGKNTGEYSESSLEIDRFVWEHKDMVIVFAAGNEGKDNDGDGVVDLSSVSTHGSAENCIAVGASESLRLNITSKQFIRSAPFEKDSLANDVNGLYAKSSRGPNSHNRIKPDLVAPGTFIISTRSQEMADIGWGTIKLFDHTAKDSIDRKYIYMGATSMATPFVSGAAVLVREYYAQQETFKNGFIPAALVHATLINGAVDLTPGQYGYGKFQEIKKRPDNAQGWGRLNLENSLNPANAQLSFVYDSLMTKEQDVFYLKIENPEIPVSVTMVYHDYPNEGGGLANDVDLTIIPLFNSFTDTIFANNRTSIDRDNNVESILIDSLQVGYYQVLVRAENITNNSENLSCAACFQPYALVATAENSLQKGFPNVKKLRKKLKKKARKNKALKKLLK